MQSDSKLMRLEHFCYRERSQRGARFLDNPSPRLKKLRLGLQERIVEKGGVTCPHIVCIAVEQQHI
jgi:hypothetical protein